MTLKSLEKKIEYAVLTSSGVMSQILPTAERAKEEAAKFKGWKAVEITTIYKEI